MANLDRKAGANPHNLKARPLAATTALVFLLALSIIQVPYSQASPDADATAELRIDGSSGVPQAGSVFHQTVQIDDDIAGDEVGGAKFSLFIPRVCVDNPTDTNPADGTLRGVKVTIDAAWNSLKGFNVIFLPDTQTHKVIVTATAKNNLFTGGGQDIAIIECTSRSVDSTFTLSFTDIQISKYDSPGHAIPIPDVQGEQKTFKVNSAPAADSQGVTTEKNTAKVITLTGSDPDGDALTFSKVSNPAHGTLSAITQLTPTSAQVTYTPTTDFLGGDSFTFRRMTVRLIATQLLYR